MFYLLILRDNARNKYKKLSEEEKNIKREDGRIRYLHMSEEKKKEYQKKNIGKLLKADNLNLIKKCITISIIDCLFGWVSSFFLSFYDFQYYFQT